MDTHLRSLGLSALLLAACGADVAPPDATRDAGHVDSPTDAATADAAMPQPDAGGPGLCGAPATGPTCGDGCAFADGESACPPPPSGSQERCDDGNTEDGDGCDSSCLVEDGWSCSVAGIPGECWREPTYEGLRATSAPIEEERPGLRAASYHEVHLVLAEPLRIAIEVGSIQLGDCPSDRLEDAPGAAYAELVRVGTTSDTYVSLDEGAASVEAGEYRLVVRAGSTRIGGYHLRVAFSSP